MRQRWSLYLMVALGVSIIFQIILIVCVGVGCLPFHGNVVFLNTVSAQLFLQIVAMCTIAVKFLFSDGVQRANARKSKSTDAGD